MNKKTFLHRNYITREIEKYNIPTIFDVQGSEYNRRNIILSRWPLFSKSVSMYRNKRDMMRCICIDMKANVQIQTRVQPQTLLNTLLREGTLVNQLKSINVTSFFCWKPIVLHHWFSTCTNFLFCNVLWLQ